MWKIPAVAAIAKAHGVSGAQVATSHRSTFQPHCPIVHRADHTRYSAHHTSSCVHFCLHIFCLQVALKWLVQQEISAVTAANNATYIREDVDLWSFQLTAAEMDTLAAI